MQSCTAGSPMASPAGGGGSPSPCLRGSNAAVAASPRSRQEGAVVAAGAAAARMGLERAVSGAVASSSKAAKNTASARSCRPAYYLGDDRVSSSRILLNMYFVLPLLLHVWFGSRFLLSGWCLPLCPTASAAATGCGGTHHGCPRLPFRPPLAATPPAGDASAITGGSGGTVSPALPAGVVSAASGAAAFIPSVSPSAASRSAVSALSTRTTSVPYTPAAASPFSGAAAAGAGGWGEASPSVPAARVLGVGVLQENPPQQRRGDVHAISAVPRVSMPTAAESAASSFASAAAAACVTVRRPFGRDLPNTLPGSASPAVLPPHQSSLSRSSLAACAAGGGDVPGSAAATPGTAAGATALEEGNGVNKQRLVSPYVAQMLYEDMLLGRALEDACFRLYYQGKTAGFVHLYTGQEAVSSGVIKLLRQDDAVVSTYRDHVHACSKGVPAKEVMAELFGKSTGCSRGRGGSMHMFSKRYNLIGGFAFIGEQIPIALGYAFSAAYRRFALTRPQSATAVPETAAAPAATAATTAAALPERHDQVTVCFLGDGTTNIGQLWEALNIAALAKLPIIFVVENNNWAIGMAAQRSTAIPRVWQRAEGFGVAGVEVDGMDVLAVRRVARRAIERARRGEGPTLIEALTYRFRGHSVADPDEMRAPKQKEAWVVRDPIIAFEEQLKAFGFANDDTIRQTRQKVDAVIKEAVQFAEKSVDTPAHECGSYIFAPAYRGGAEAEKLSEQQLHAYAEALKEELDWKARVKAGDRSPRKPITQTFNLPTIID